MKKIFGIFIASILMAFICACEDPYRNDTFAPYDVQPISSYLSTREQDFSEWIKILKYTDMYNAVNQASQYFTMFAPTNEAVETFFKEKRVSSIEELGQTYARQLVQYHVLNDTLTNEQITIEGALPYKTLSGEQLEVSFKHSDDASGVNAIYLNGDAHIKELGVRTSNGWVYVLDDVMRPAVESVFEKMHETGKNDIMVEAITRTGWNDTLNIIADTITLPSGLKQEVRRHYTLLGVPDDVFKAAGINSCDDLAKKLEAGSDYTNKDNALNRYIAYHILDGRYKTTDLQKFDVDSLMSSQLWQTACEGTIIKVSREADGKYYFNHDSGENTTLLEAESNIQGKNGYVHELNGYLPICTTLKPTMVLWDLADYPEVANYIDANGAEGQVFQQGIAEGRVEPNTELLEVGLGCYRFQTGSQGIPKSDYGNLAYRTLRLNSTYDQQDATKRALNEDILTISLGYQGWVEMRMPILVPGKYKVTLRYFYANSMEPFREFNSGSNGGKTTFQFMDNPAKPYTFLMYSGLPSEKNEQNVFVNRMGFYEQELYSDITLNSSGQQWMRITFDDPAASISSVYRLQVDYIKFEPVN